MNRRGFLRAALQGVPLLAVSAELAEMLAPRKTIILPPARGWPTTLSRKHIKAIVDAMKERNIVWDDYYSISWPTTARAFVHNGLHWDPTFTGVD